MRSRIILLRNIEFVEVIKFGCSHEIRKAVKGDGFEMNFENIYIGRALPKGFGLDSSSLSCSIFFIVRPLIR